MDKRRIVFVIFDGFQSLDLTGPHEVFQHASPLPPEYDCQVVSRTPGPVRSGGGLPVHASQGVRGAGPRRGGPPRAGRRNDPVNAVARRCGFGSAESLRRAFHRHLGVAPSDYRDRFGSLREYV